MKRLLFSLFPSVVAFYLFFVLFTVKAEAINIRHPKYKHGSGSIVPGSYIVSFNSKQPRAGISFASSLKRELSNSKFEIRHDLTHELFNGVSISVDAADKNLHLASMKAILDRSDVALVWPVKLLARPRAVSSFNMSTPPPLLPHTLTQVDQVHNILQNKGKGIFVGVIDTGVDYLHPALGGGFGEGFKVIKGYDLVGNNYNGTNTPEPSNDPLDACGADSGSEGHGTHVSGIIAGLDTEKNFTGVAPEASLGMWRIFGCTGSAANDLIIKALLMAYDAGCDVINLSVVDSGSWSNTTDPESDVINSIAANGVSVVTSAGNAGDEGIYTVSEPSTAIGAFSVASVQSDFYLTSKITATGIDHDIFYIENSQYTIKNGPIAIGDNNPGGPSDCCTAGQISSDINGKIALIGEGSCSFAEQVYLATAAGAVGAVIYSNNTKGIALVILDATVTIPVVSISQADGQDLINSIKNNSVNLTFHKQNYWAPAFSGGSVSSFSSTGSSSELNFKPNIAGIGGNVYSTLPRYLGGWGVMSGTSMSSPYVAGSIALYKSYKGKKDDTNYINEQFQNYAKTTWVYSDSGVSYDTPLRQGAGLVQVYETLTENVHVTPAQISLNDSATTDYLTQTFTVTNNGSNTVSYTLSNLVAVGYAPYDVENYGYIPLEPGNSVVANASLTFTNDTFELAPGEIINVTFTVTPPDTSELDHIFYGGFIKLSPADINSNSNIKIPYFGVKGVQKKLPIFDFSSGFPAITNYNGDYIFNSSIENYVFDRSDNVTIPYIGFRVITPTKLIRAVVINASSEEAIGDIPLAEPLYYVGRQFLNNYINAYYDYPINTTIPWEGTYIPYSINSSGTAIPAPDGDYKVQLSALKLLGDPSTNTDWEFWTSNLITLKN